MTATESMDLTPGMDNPVRFDSPAAASYNRLEPRAGVVWHSNGGNTCVVLS